MPDIQIINDGVPTESTRVSMRGGMRWISLTVGYFFYVDNDNPDDFNYVKTTDRGQTWGAPVLIKSSDPAGFILSYDLWFDRETNGDTGNLIHITYIVNNPDGIFYRSLDTDTDVLSSEVVVFAQGTSAGSSPFSVSITKARGGNFGVGWNILPVFTGASGFATSTNGGSSWVVRADLFAGENEDDQFLLYSGNESDNQDIWCAYWDVSANEISLKTFDDSANIWSEVLIQAGMVDSVASNQMAGAIDFSDDSLIFVAHENLLVAEDFKAWRINGAGSIVALTDVFTAGVDKLSACLTIDQNTGNYYVAYADGPTPFTSMQVRYQISTDRGITWGAAVQYSTTARTYRGISNNLSTATLGQDGRWQPSMFDQISPDEAFTNFGNSIELSGGIPPTPNPPAPIIAQPVGGQAGTILYITPDNREYQLITPHTPGRHVLSFQGLGTPPIEYVTQRGPFQDGETVKDFFLRPRTVQILERQNFCDRDAWWNGRSELLNELRPNRQTTPDGTTPGRLRFFRTDGTARDLRVFISTGPVFEPRVSNEWDEWSIEELLRFIAHDPIFFSTTQTTSAFVIALDDDLVFPITFPIQFGDGLVDDTLNITYTGTWETFPIITIVGPIQTPRIDNNTTGEKLEFTIDIAPGQTVTIDLTEGVKTVVDQTGANLIGALTTDSDIGSFHIAPDPEAANGLNVIRFRGSNPSGSTSVSLLFFTRFFGM